MEGFCEKHGGHWSVSRLRDKNNVWICPICAQQQLMRIRHGKPVNTEQFQAAVYTLTDPPQYYIGL